LVRKTWRPLPEAATTTLRLLRSGDDDSDLAGGLDGLEEADEDTDEQVKEPAAVVRRKDEPLDDVPRWLLARVTLSGGGYVE